jgi:hypothetical protein
MINISMPPPCGAAAAIAGVIDKLINTSCYSSKFFKIILVMHRLNLFATFC